MKILLNRRSVKSYKKDAVPQELLEKITEAGKNAPTGMNRQSPVMVAITNPETLRDISKLNAGILGTDSDPFYGAKDMIIVLAKKEGTYIYDGSLAMGNLLNAAWSADVGAIWIHRAKEVFESEEGKVLLKEWGITDDVEGIGFCMLGYTKDEKAKTDIKDGRVFYV